MNYYDIERNLTEMMEADHELCDSKEMDTYLAFVKHTNPAVSTMRFCDVINNRKNLGLPSVGSVDRVRRNIQMKRPDLRCTPKTEKHRAESMEETLDYVEQV